MYDKPLSEHEMALHDFIINGLERTKLASMIYGVSNIKGECMGYNERYSNPKAKLFKKPSDPSFSSIAQTELKTYFVSASNKGKILNQSKPKITESKVLNKSVPETSKSKVMNKSEPNI